MFQSRAKRWSIYFETSCRAFECGSCNNRVQIDLAAWWSHVLFCYMGEDSATWGKDSYCNILASSAYLSALNCIAAAAQKQKSKDKKGCGYTAPMFRGWLLRSALLGRTYQLCLMQPCQVLLNTAFAKTSWRSTVKKNLQYITWILKDNLVLSQDVQINVSKRKIACPRICIFIFGCIHLHLFHFSPLCVFKCVLKHSESERLYSHIGCTLGFHL